MLVGQKPVQHASTGDFVTAEGLPFKFGHYNPSLLSLFMKGARADRMVQGVTSRSVYDYHDFTVRPTADLKWEIFTYLTHGCQCTIVDKANYEGTSDPLVYERLGEIFEEARQKRDLFGHDPVQEVGLYYSCRTRDWFARDDSPKYLRAIWGAQKALVQSHITMGFVMDENVSLERLRAFPVIYVPHAAILSAQELDLFEEYVRQGGHLLITGLSGMCDRFGQFLDSVPGLVRLVGAKLVQRQVDYPDNYVRLPGHLARGEGKFLLEDIPADWPMLTWGPIAVFEPKESQAYGELMVAYRTQDNIWSWRMSPEKVVGPAILIRELGKGKVVCVPCAIDAAYVGDYRMPEQRNLIRNLIRYLNPRPEIIVEAPENVEIAVTHDKERNRLLVHFVNFSGSPTSAADPFSQGWRVLPPLMERSLPYSAKVHLNRRFTEASASEPEASLLAARQEIEVKTSSVHTTLTIRLPHSA